MQTSKQTVPHFYLMADVDMTEVQRMRQYCLDAPDWARVPTYTDAIVHACARALASMPEINVTYTDQGLLAPPTVGVGVAVGTEEGLRVPVLQSADRLSLQETSRGIQELAERARQGRMRAADLSGRSMVVTNLGMYGVDTFVAIIDMPDPVILAVGRVADRVTAVNGQPAVRPMCTLTLSVDHRVLDGILGAQFLGEIKAQLEKAMQFLEANQ
jgi:pyruvate dehydrogenase E2 component (dihydrolipoamide acetyltransferase)